MNGLSITILIIFGVLLVGTILLQPGTKGGGLGASFGGGGANSAFGAQGATPFLSKLTYWLAAAFLGTTLIIEILVVRSNRSVLDKAADLPATTQAPAPAVPPAPATPAAPAPAKK
ncbi:MAG TPA: preprotein translocase subunit SecG [Holophagaceae bacterium]